MGLIICSDCAGKVSTAAAACPHCGRPTGAAPPVVAPPRGSEAVTGLGESRGGLGHLVSPVGALLLLVGFFFLPWIEMTMFGHRVGSLTGMDFARMAEAFWVIPGGALLTLASCVYFGGRGELPRARSTVAVATTLPALVVVYYLTRASEALQHLPFRVSTERALSELMNAGTAATALGWLLMGLGIAGLPTRPSGVEPAAAAIPPPSRAADPIPDLSAELEEVTEGVSAGTHDPVASPPTPARPARSRSGRIAPVGIAATALIAVAAAGYEELRPKNLRDVRDLVALHSDRPTVLAYQENRTRATGRVERRSVSETYTPRGKVNGQDTFELFRTVYADDGVPSARTMQLFLGTDGFGYLSSAGEGGAAQAWSPPRLIYPARLGPGSRWSGTYRQGARTVSSQCAAAANPSCDGGVIVTCSLTEHGFTEESREALCPGVGACAYSADVRASNDGVGWRTEMASLMRDGVRVTPCPPP